MAKIRPMLAAAKFEPAHIEEHLRQCGTLIMQPKIDGMRAMIDEECIPRSRSWKEHKSRYLRQWAMQHPSLRGLDGEVVSGHVYSADTFRESMSGIRAEDGSPEFTFFAFDYFLDPYKDMPYSERRAMAAAIVDRLGENQVGDTYHAKLLLCPQRIVASLDEIYQYEEELLVAGWEGGILRRADRPYKYNRATSREGALIKLKRFEDDEAVVVGYEPWYVNNNVATESALGYTARSSHQENLVAIDRLGALKCELLRDRSISFDIGVFRGWSHSDRDTLWAVRDTLLGRIIKFKHQGYGGGYDRPRTPVGLGWRDVNDL